jgi:hypothetical protein
MASGTLALGLALAALGVKIAAVVTRASSSRRLTAELVPLPGTGDMQIVLANSSRKSFDIDDWELVSVEPASLRWVEIGTYRPERREDRVALGRFGDFALDLGADAAPFIMASTAGRGRLHLRLTIAGRRQPVDVEVKLPQPSGAQERGRLLSETT